MFPGALTGEVIPISEKPSGVLSSFRQKGWRPVISLEEIYHQPSEFSIEMLPREEEDEREE
jgi:hypothetical protein